MPPLDGITVLDLTRVLSGPYCTMMLADMGARVIKVEQPGKGDDTRAWGPPFIEGESAYFLSINRNKESIALDFKKPAGRTILDALVAITDMVAGTFAAHGIVLALFARERTGRGQMVDLAMLDSVVGLLSYQASIYFATGSAPGRMGNRHPTIAPYETFSASDGDFVLAVGNDDQWRRFCAAAAFPADERFATNRDRVTRHATL